MNPPQNILEILEKSRQTESALAVVREKLRCNRGNEVAAVDALLADIAEKEKALDRLQ